MSSFRRSKPVPEDFTVEIQYSQESSAAASSKDALSPSNSSTDVPPPALSPSNSSDKPPPPSKPSMVARDTSSGSAALSKPSTVSRDTSSGSAVSKPKHKRVGSSGSGTGQHTRTSSTASGSGVTSPPVGPVSSESAFASLVLNNLMGGHYPAAANSSSTTPGEDSQQPRKLATFVQNNVLKKKPTRAARTTSTGDAAAASTGFSSMDLTKPFSIQRGTTVGGGSPPTGRQGHRRGNTVDNDFLSKATQHEQEAGALLERCKAEAAQQLLMQQQQQQQQQMQQQQQQEAPGGGGGGAPGMMPLKAQPSARFLEHDDGVPPPPPQQVEAAAQPTLTETANYLQALQQQASQDRPLSSSQATAHRNDDDHDNEQPNESLTHMNPTDRIMAAAGVLKAASAFKRNTASKKLQRQPTTSRLDVSTNTAPAVPPSSASNVTAGAGVATAGSSNQPPDDEGRGGDDSKANNNNNNNPGFLAAFPGRARNKVMAALHAGKAEWYSFQDFFKPQQQTLVQTYVFVILAIFIPCLIVSAILFYIVGNPPTGRCKDGPCGLDKNGNPAASASWWVLFLGVRQVFMWCIAKWMDFIVIDWWVLQHPWIVRLLGPHLSLMIVQSKGWPSILFWWGILDFGVLYGPQDFMDHWLYWQDKMKMFTKENPAGTVLTAEWYQMTLIAMVIVPVMVTLKRHFLGLHLGKRLYVRFNERLQETMKEITLVSELALWTRRRSDNRHRYATWLKDFQLPTENKKKMRNSKKPRAPDPAALSESMATNSIGYGSHVPSEDKIDYEDLLDEWTEPKKTEGDTVSGHEIIAFQQGLAVAVKPFFFSSAFGPVETREQCNQSADRLFRRLLKLFSDPDTDAFATTINVKDLTHWMFKGATLTEQKEKAAHLSLLLNPDSNNNLNIVDFVRGMDQVYQKVRLLENAVENASHIDRAYGKVINVAFYFLVFCIVLSLYSLNPFTFILSLSSLIVAFAFMIGPGAAVFFEGVVMVLGRQPYDIGDRVAIALPNAPPDFDGSPQWIVESIDLVATTARLADTGEVASFSNGSLARLRLINHNRSPDPVCYVKVKFGTDIPYSTILIFKSAIQQFVDDRSQEFVSLAGFRPSRIEAQLNFVEYSIVLCTRLPWQNLIAIRESRAAVASFAVEVQKQMGCRYVAPPMPVDIRLMGANRFSSAMLALKNQPPQSDADTDADGEEDTAGGDGDGDSTVKSDKE